MKDSKVVVRLWIWFTGQNGKREISAWRILAMAQDSRTEEMGKLANSLDFMQPSRLLYWDFWKTMAELAFSFGHRHWLVIKRFRQVVVFRFTSLGWRPFKRKIWGQRSFSLKKEFFHTDFLFLLRVKARPPFSRLFSFVWLKLNLGAQQPSFPSSNLASISQRSTYRLLSPPNHPSHPLLQ